MYVRFRYKYALMMGFLVSTGNLLFIDFGIFFASLLLPFIGVPVRLCYIDLLLFFILLIILSFYLSCVLWAVRMSMYS